MNILKRTPKRLTASILSLLFVILPCSAVMADTATTAYNFSDINLAISVPSDLVSYTRTVTSNNAYLDLIGVDDVETLRGLMIANGIYLEAVPKDVSYEIVISGKPADTSAKNFNELSDDDLKSQFNNYIQSYSDAQNNNNSTDNPNPSNITETVTGTNLYKNTTTSYYVVDVKSVSNNATTTYIKKYYTIMMGNVIQFTLQSNGQPVSDEMAERLTNIVESAQYKTIKKTLKDNAFLSEMISTVATLGVPIAILGLLAFVVSKSTKKTNRQIEEDTKRAKALHEQRNRRE